MNKDTKNPVDADMKSRRELLGATAKLSAFIGAMGLTGAGLSGTAAADKKVPGIQKTGDITLKRGVISRMSPAMRQRELKGLLNEPMRTGNSRLALKRHPNLKLNRRQTAALMRLSKSDWAHLRRLKSQLAPLGELAAGDTGYVFW